MGKGFGLDSAYRHKAVMAFGIVQLIVGIVVFSSGIAVVVKKSWVSSTFHGITAGIWIILTGALGLAGGLKRNRCLEIAFMVLSIISSITTWLGLVIISLGGMIADSIYSEQELYSSDPEALAECWQDSLENLDKEFHAGYFNCPNKPAAIANAVMLIMGGLLFLIAILSASFACCAVCKCCGGGSENEVQSIPYGHNQPGYGQQSHYGSQP